MSIKMFRKMMREKQQLPPETCIELLKNCPRGVLSVLGDDDYPYGMPMNHWYCPENGHLYFHGCAAGHKIDAIRKHGKASFCVYDEGFRREGEWALNIRSVIVFGRIRILEDREEVLSVCRRLSYKYTDDSAYIEHEIVHSGPGVLCFELIPESVTGKIVNES